MDWASDNPEFEQRFSRQCLVYLSPISPRVRGVFSTCAWDEDRGSRIRTKEEGSGGLVDEVDAEEMEDEAAEDEVCECAARRGGGC